jgi:glycosyltransferase involved in cell wall biosynthesis
VLYPRFLSVPRFLKPLDPLSIAATLLVTVARHPELAGSDLVDIHCAYPDGLAGAILARLLGKPSTVTLRGHDVNDVPQLYPLRRLEVKATLALVDRVLGVAKALVDSAVELGAPAAKCAVVANGVDPAKFYPRDREECRAELGLPRAGKMVLAVGYLVRRKGLHLLTEALGRLRRSGMTDLFAAYVGSEGDEPGVMREVEALMERYGLRPHIHLPGRVDEDKLVAWYNAADVLCLASDKEGWPNVLLESLACGTPVVATNVWGIPEVIRSPEVGILVERTVPAIQAGLREALGRRWDRDAIVAYSAEHTWSATAGRVVAEFERVLDARAGPGRARASSVGGVVTGRDA